MRSPSQRLHPGPAAASAPAAWWGLRSPCVTCVSWGLGPSLLHCSCTEQPAPEADCRGRFRNHSHPFVQYPLPPLPSSVPASSSARPPPHPQAHTEPSPGSLGASSTFPRFPGSSWHLPQSLRAPGTFQALTSSFAAYPRCFSCASAPPPGPGAPQRRLPALLLSSCGRSFAPSVWALAQPRAGSWRPPAKLAVSPFLLVCEKVLGGTASRRRGVGCVC